MDQTRLGVVSARNDSEQAGIGCCLVIAVLNQHSHFATARFRPTGTVNPRRSCRRAPQVLDADERQHFDDPRDLVLFAGPLCADPIHRLSGLARH
jgi:hypothetical protein